MVVPFWASYLESYKVIPKRNYYGAYGYMQKPKPQTPSIRAFKAKVQDLVLGVRGCRGGGDLVGLSLSGEELE